MRKISVMLWGVGILVVALAGAPARAQDATAFDGSWNVRLDCPPLKDDQSEGAKGYVHLFPAQVKAGAIRGSHGVEGQPGWLLLTGKIPANGTANLRVDGLVNNPDYALNNAPRGKPYGYRVRAKFESSAGTGERIGQRKCSFEFKKVA